MCIEVSSSATIPAPVRFGALARRSPPNAESQTSEPAREERRLLGEDADGASAAPA